MASSLSVISWYYMQDDAGGRVITDDDFLKRMITDMYLSPWMIAAIVFAITGVLSELLA
ncbi:MAG: hypothetical protein ACYC6A_13725 [Armatimonadota bacterium]